MNGRFLKLNFDIMSMITALCVRSIDGEDGGGSAEPSAEDQWLDSQFPESAPVDDGNASDKEAPASDTEADSKPAGEEGDTKQSEPSKEQPLGVTDEDLSSALKAEESPEDKTTRLESKLAASSTEGKRLSAENKALTEFLESQGLKAVVVDGKVQAVPTEKYSDKVADISTDITKMSVADQEALESGEPDQQQPIIDKLIRQAKEAYVRANPTLDKEPATISEEQTNALFERMTSAKDVNDNPVYENVEVNRKHIEATINDEALDSSVREAFAKSPEFLAKILNDHINAVRSRLVAKKASEKKNTEKKKSEAQRSANPSVDGEGVATEKGGNAEDDYLDRLFG